MKKTSVILVLGLALMLLVAGCSTSADRGQYDYVPYGGQGCAFSADYDSGNVVVYEVNTDRIEAKSFL